MSEQTNAREYLAKVCANIVRAQGLSAEEEIQVGAKIIQQLATNDRNDKQSPKSRADSKPPVEVSSKELVPNAPTRTMAKAGGDCTCACGKVLYKIVKDVTDPMGLDDFISAFEPVGHEGKLDKLTNLRNIDGNVLVDCKVCNKQLGVCLIGSMASAQLPDSPTGDVGSVGGGEVGSM